MSKERHKYDIHIQGLENKQYEFEFEGGDKFFAEFEQDIIAKGSFRANVSLEKSSTMIQLAIKITGSIELTCDRSLEQFDEPLDIQQRYIYKFGDRHEELSDEIEIIPFGTATINLMHHLYDFIMLTVPMKKLHQRFRDEEEDYIYTLEGDEIEEDEVADDETPIDPRWAALKGIKLN